MGSISTPWSGEIRPRRSGVVESIELSAAPTDIRKGDLLGWFNMGSTVILLLPPDSCSWRGDFQPGDSTVMGEAIGELAAPGA